MLKDEFVGIPYTHCTNRFTLYIPKKYRSLFSEIVTYAGNKETSVSEVILEEMKESFRIRKKVNAEMMQKQTQT